MPDKLSHGASLRFLVAQLRFAPNNKGGAAPRPASQKPSRVLLAGTRPAPSAAAASAARRLHVRAAIAPTTDDLVIDLTGPTVKVAPSVAGSPHSAGWRNPRWILLTVVAVLAGSLAIGNYATGMRWRAQALVAQERAARATADAATQQEAVRLARNERATAEARREAMAKQLAVSEADVAALEARIEALASDKARGEDLGHYVALSDRSALLRALQAQLDSCVAQVDALRVGLRRGDATAAWRSAANAAHVTCAQASADAAALDARE